MKYTPILLLILINSFNMSGHSMVAIMEVYNKTKAEDNAIKLYNRK